MNIQEQIRHYITSQPEPKRSDMEVVHKRIIRALPEGKLWFLDGKNDKGKIVFIPNKQNKPG